MFGTSIGSRFMKKRLLPLAVKMALVLTLGIAGATTPGCGCGGDGDGTPGVTGSGLEFDDPTVSLLSSSLGVNARRWFRVGFTSELNEAVIEAADNVEFIVASIPEASMASGSVSVSNDVAVGDKLDYISRAECADSNGDGESECTSVLFRAAIPYCVSFSINLKGLDSEGNAIAYGADGRTLADTDGDGKPNDKLLGPFAVRSNPADVDGDCKSDVLLMNPYSHINSYYDFPGGIEDPVEMNSNGRSYLMKEANLLGLVRPRYVVSKENGLMLNGSSIEATFEGELRNIPDDTGIEAALLEHTIWTQGQILGDMNGDGVGDAALSSYNAQGNGGAGSDQQLLIWDAGFGEGAAAALENVPTNYLPLGFATQDIPGFVFPARDVNGDGLDDMIMASLTFLGAGKSGSIALFLGSASGVALSASYALPADVYPLSAKGVGDLNGDGYNDLAVNTFSFGISGDSFTWNGFEVLVFLGAADAATIMSSPIVLADTAVDTGFGISFSGGGDVNGDGLDDIAVGAPAGLVTAALRLIDPIIEEYRLTGDFSRFADFGGQVLDEMGFAGNIAVAPATSVGPGDDDDINLGKVYLFYGGNSFVANAELSSSVADAVITGDNDQEAEGMGQVLGDIFATVDNLMEEAIGVRANLPEVSRFPDLFGMAVMIGEVNGDGLGDLFVGAPLAVEFDDSNFVYRLIKTARSARNIPTVISSVNAAIGSIGKVYIFEGSQEFASATYASALGAVLGTDAFGFGAFMSPAVDVDNDGNDDVALGGFTLGTLSYDVDGDGTNETGPDLKYMKAIFLGGDRDGDGDVDMIGTDTLSQLTLADSDASFEYDFLSLMEMLENIGYVWVQ